MSLYPNGKTLTLFRIKQMKKHKKDNELLRVIKYLDENLFGK